MEHQFIAISEKAPRLAVLEADSAQKFLVLYESYVHRNVLGGAIVPMASCLEKDDLLELLEETEDEILTVAVEALRNQNGMAAAINAEEAPVGGHGSDEEEQAESGHSDSSTDEDDAGVGRGVKVQRPKRYVRLSTEHVKAMLACYLGPRSVDESLLVFRKLKMNKDDVAFTNNRQATTYLREWKVAQEWCVIFMPRSKLLIKSFLGS